MAWNSPGWVLLILPLNTIPLVSACCFSIGRFVVLQPLVVCFTLQWCNWKNGLFLCRPFCGVAAAGDPFHSLQPLAVHITPQWYNKGKTIEFCFSVNCFGVFAASRPRSPRLCSPFWQQVTTMTTRSCYIQFVGPSLSVPPELALGLWQEIKIPKTNYLFVCRCTSITVASSRRQNVLCCLFVRSVPCLLLQSPCLCHEVPHPLRPTVATCVSVVSAWVHLNDSKGAVGHLTALFDFQIGQEKEPVFS